MEEDHLFELNYSITLFNNDELDKAREHFAEFEKLFVSAAPSAPAAAPAARATGHVPALRRRSSTTTRRTPTPRSSSSKRR